MKGFFVTTLPLDFCVGGRFFLVTLPLGFYVTGGLHKLLQVDTKFAFMVV